MSVVSTQLTSTPGLSLRALQRQLATLLPDAGVSGTVGDGPSLEAARTQTEPARLISAAVIEGSALRASAVEPQEAGETTGFCAFLDGTQESRVLQYANGLPLIVGKVAAVVRVRKARRMTTWRHEVSMRVYAPRQLLSDQWNSALDALGAGIVDTSAATTSAAAAEHPFAVRDAAIHKVQEDRERAEHRLAEEWCSTVGEPLFIDGGISANDRVATERCVVGVVKSHRTLYAEGEGLQVVFRLRAGERTSVFQITSPKRTPVASWYMRLRDPAGHDPMWGLVRVEVASPPELNERNIAARAEEVTRWILAESAPNALPDSRWDKMVYGIRDCEEFLRAVM